jgi:hypothetical protein
MPVVEGLSVVADQIEKSSCAGASIASIHLRYTTATNNCNCQWKETTLCVSFVELAACSCKRSCLWGVHKHTSVVLRSCFLVFVFHLLSRCCQYASLSTLSKHGASKECNGLCHRQVRNAAYFLLPRDKVRANHWQSKTPQNSIVSAHQKSFRNSLC